MAVMWPRKLPVSVLADSRRTAEVRVYNRLQETLTDDFHVFYSRPWLGLKSTGEEIDGESDFLIAHKIWGLLAIEVKGGAITYDAQKAQWISRDRYGFNHRIKNPVHQAMTAKHVHTKIIQKRFTGRRFNHTHGVIFTDSVMPDHIRTLGENYERKIFCSSTQFVNAFQEWIEERMHVNKRPASCHDLGQDGLDYLQEKVAGSFCLSFNIGAYVAENEEVFAALEPEQYLVLDYIQNIKRALISGGAGTGKTLLAVESAIRACKAGKRTLLVCHGRPLESFLRSRMSKVRNLTVSTFHSLCGRMLKEASLEVPLHAKEVDLYQIILPELLAQSAQFLPDKQFDAVIIDEGQDFKPEWFIALDYWIAPETGILRVFMDSNQSVYDWGECTVKDIDSVSIPLTRNLRNSKQIHELAMKHYTGPDIKPGGPDGHGIDWVIIPENGTNTLEAAKQKLLQLLNQQDVSPEMVAVLVETVDQVSRLCELLRASGFSLDDAENLGSAHVIVDTIRRFKGLERPVTVVVFEGGAIVDRRELAYVSFSRAKSYLAVVCTEPLKRILCPDSNDSLL